MLYAVLFEDNEGQDHLRQTHMQDHLAFLSANPAIQAAGPLFTPAGAGAGGMWLVSAPEAAVVAALTEADPFFPTGLRKSITILEWRQVFRDGQRLTP